jgi:hypothetical protein
LISNVSICGILTIAIAIIGSMFLFGLDEKISNGLQNTTSMQALAEQHDESNDIYSEPDTPHEELGLTDKQDIPSKKQDSKSQKKQDAAYPMLKDAENLEKKIKEFEKKIFMLKGTGTYYQGAAHNSRSSSIDITLKPIPNTNLSNFEIIAGTMDLGIGFSADNGQVVIDDGKITITLNREDHHDVYGVISGSFLGSILNDNKNKHTVLFEDQIVSIGDEAQDTLHLTINAILSS